MAYVRFAFPILILLALSCNADAACGVLDPKCNAGKVIDKAAEEARFRSEIRAREEEAREKAARKAGWITKKAIHGLGEAAVTPAPYGKTAVKKASGFRKTTGDAGPTADRTKPLQPVRAFLRAKDIPPAGAGAYGVVVFHSRPTSANRSRLKMVCNSFVAFFPRSEAATVPLKDQMITVWPLDNPDAAEAMKDDCDYAIDHYDLIASDDAIRDARRQRATFEGEGPYLVGWSPSRARGVPDALVLVMDMSADNSQAQIDQKFLFWKNKIVEDPSAWRDGFSIERVRVAIRIFADQYGQSMLDAIKLIGEKKP